MQHMIVTFIPLSADTILEILLVPVGEMIIGNLFGTVNNPDSSAETQIQWQMQRILFFAQFFQY